MGNARRFKRQIQHRNARDYREYGGAPFMQLAPLTEANKDIAKAFAESGFEQEFGAKPGPQDVSEWDETYGFEGGWHTVKGSDPSTERWVVRSRSIR
jgi:hypothetical protein